MPFAYLDVEKVSFVLCNSIILWGFKKKHLGEMLVGLNFLGKRWLFWGETTAEVLRYCLKRPILRMREGEVVSNICFFSHPGRKRSKYKKQAPASFKLTLKTGLIKQYLSLSAVITPQNSHLFPRKLRPTNISSSCCYLKPHKIMQLHKMKKQFSTSRKANGRQCACFSSVLN